MALRVHSCLRWPGRLRAGQLMLALALAPLVAPAASASSIWEVTYEFVFDSGTPNQASYNRVRGTPLGIGNGNVPIGTDRLGPYDPDGAGGDPPLPGPPDIFAPSTLTLQFQDCGGFICDGPVTIVDMIQNNQFTLSIVDTDLFVESSGLAEGTLTGDTIVWDVDASLETETSGGVFCTGGLCGLGGLSQGWNDQSGPGSIALNDFVFGDPGGPEPTGGLTTNHLIPADGATITQFWVLSELDRTFIIPEPGSLVLLGFGSLGIAWQGRRRRRR